jgi:hypothetical protein
MCVEELCKRRFKLEKLDAKNVCVIHAKSGIDVPTVKAASI